MKPIHLRELIETITPQINYHLIYPSKLPEANQTKKANQINPDLYNNNATNWERFPN